MSNETIDELMADFAKNVRVNEQIEFPIEVSGIESNMGTSEHGRQLGRTIGSWVSVRPVDDQKTYLGVYLGDMTIGVLWSYHLEKKILDFYPQRNPAIYIPDLKKVIWGVESWWRFIESPDELKQITDADIQNVWYVRAMKELLKADDAKGGNHG